MEKRKKLTKQSTVAPSTHSPLRANRVQVNPRPSQTTPTTKKPLQQKEASRSRFVSKKYLAFGGACVIIIIVGIVVTSQFSNHNSVKKPAYKTVLPADTSIRELGGWKRVSPPGKTPVFAYTDTIDGVTISVSQQSLPESFKSDVDSKTAELAKRFSATTKLDADGTTVYVGTSSKGPQSTILSKDNLLILIKSEKKISDKSWTTYVKSLR